MTKRVARMPQTMALAVLLGLLATTLFLGRAETSGASFATPEQPIRAYFDALASASNLTVEEMAAAGGSVGSREPYLTAYAYWNEDWRSRHSYAEFLESWKRTAHVQLLKLLPAGEAGQRRRFFVEARSIEAVGPELRFGIFYYYGFFEVERGPSGWVIADGRLQPEEPLFRIGGHQPWREDPEMVARRALAGSGQPAPGEAEVTRHADGTATVRFAAVQGKEVRSVVLAQREDGIWEILYSSVGAGA